MVTVHAIPMKIQTVFPAAKKDITTVNNLVTVLAILMKILTVLQLQAAQKDLVIGLMIAVDVAVQKIILWQLMVLALNVAVIKQILIRKDPVSAWADTSLIQVKFLS